MTSPKLWFYGWRILIVSSIFGAVGVAITISGFSVFFLPIRDDLNLSSTQVSFLLGLAWAQSGVMALVMGWLADHFGTRKLVLFGGITCGVGLMLVSLANNFWQLILLYSVIVAIGRTAAFNPTLLATINQWFVRRKAIAMSLLGTSFTAGAAVIIPLFALGSASIGWRHTIFIAGLVLCLLTLPAAKVIRNKPEDMGLLPDGDKPVSGLPTQDEASNNMGMSLRQALATRAFWLILVGLVLRVSVADAILIHSIPMLVWKGISEQSAAYFVSLIFLFMIPVRLGLGISGAFIPPSLVLFGGMTIGAISLAAFLFMDGTNAAIPFIATLVAIEGASALNWIAIGDYFGRRSFATLAGIMTISYSIGALLAPVGAGWIFDRTDSYATVLKVLSPTLLIAGLAFAFARKPSSAR